MDLTVLDYFYVHSLDKFKFSFLPHVGSSFLFSISLTSQLSAAATVVSNFILSDRLSIDVGPLVRALGSARHGH